MNDRRKLVILVSAGVVLAVLAGVAVGWLFRGSEVTKLQETVSELEGDDNGSKEETHSAPTTFTVQPPEAPPQQQEQQAPPAEQAPPATQPETSVGPNERQVGYVTSVVNAGGTWKLQIDYVQWLTGGEAADAAAARGDESPPPNDYYLINDNPKIREFPVQAGIGVLVVTNAEDGSCDPMGHVMALSEWAAAMSGPYAEVFKSNLYWVTVTNGTITAIQAQYVP